MKRLLLLAGTLAAAAMLLWLFARRPAPPSAQPASAGLPLALPEPATPPAEQAPVADAGTSARAPAAVQQAAPGKSEPPRSAPTRRGQPAALVGVVIQFAGTHAPVRNALASLMYDLEGQKTQTERMQPLKDGRFELAVPLGARLRALDACGPALMLEGPRVPSNAGSRFLPLRAALDSTVGPPGTELRFEVQPARDLEGVVLDAQGRTPLQGAEVDAWLPVGRRMRERTGADGRFQLTEPGAGQPLRVRCDGYLETEILLLPADFGARDPGLVVLLDRGLRVCGSVFDEHGAPVRSAALELHTRGTEAGGRAIPTDDRHRARTDAQGSFCFENVPRCAQATIHEPAQELGIPARTRAHQELGALRSDVEGLFLLCRDGAPIDLRVARRDGTPVEPSKYFCTSEDAGLLDDVLPPRPGTRSLKFVALRVAVRLVVFARERDDDPNHLLVGRRTLHLEQPESKPLEVRILLDEPLDATPPPSSAPEIAPRDEGVFATLDLRLLDYAGKPFPAGTRMDFELGGKPFGQLAPADSELRLRCPPSPEAYRARVKIGSQSRAFDLALPMPGYARAEQRLWIAP